MHPGPVNRGVELSAEVIDSPQAVIGQQVEAGVVVRMAVLYELLAGPLRAAARPHHRPGARLSMLDHRPIAARRRPDQGRPRPRPAHRARRARSTSSIRNGEIAEIGDRPRSADVEVIDGEGRHLFPGFVDPHVHLRVPGQEHKEDLETGTRSAAAGGFVAVVAMPNTSPTVDSAPDPALAARAGPPRGAHPRRLPRQRHARPGRASR